MFSTISAIPTLLLGTALLLGGNGFLGTLLAVRAGQEGFSSVVIGIVMAGYFWGFVLGTYYCPRIVRRVGHIRAFTSLAAMTATAAVVHGFVVNSLVWFLLRFAVGFCLVGIYMVIESWMNALAEPTRRGQFFSTYMTVALASLGGGQFLLLFNTAYPLVPFALASMFFTLGIVPIALTHVREPNPLPDPPEFKVGRLRETSPAGVVGAVGAGLLTGAFWGLAPLFARGMGFSEPGIALFMGAAVFGGVALQWPVGHYSDRHDRRQVLAFVAVGGALVALSLYFSSYVARGTLGLLGFAWGGLLFPIYSLSVAHVNDNLKQEEILSGTRILLLLNGLGAASGPLAAGVLMEFLGPAALMLFMAVTFTGIAVYSMHTLSVPLLTPIEEQGEFIPLTRTSPMALELHPAAIDERTGEDVEDDDR